MDKHCGLSTLSAPILDLVASDVVLHGLGYKRVGRAIFRLAAVLRNLKPNVVLSSIGHLNLALLPTKPLLPKRTKAFVREVISLPYPLQQESRTVCFVFLTGSYIRMLTELFVQESR